jgi:hypothetical protein
MYMSMLVFRFIATIRFRKFTLSSALHSSSVTEKSGSIFFFISTRQFVSGLYQYAVNRK